ncbi:hypothetical protein GCM10022216_02380 [Sphingobacterium kyonggiense]|uniref:Uncharacterized protein n=1 Tax=Sphingobacterium kyonggiense TaxID=714075 RepID=A0ABP7Y7Q8_9SPHI
MYAVLRPVNNVIAFIDAEAHRQHIGQYQEDTERFNVPEGGVYIFELCEHIFWFYIVL